MHSGNIRFESVVSLNETILITECSRLNSDQLGPLFEYWVRNAILTVNPRPWDVTLVTSWRRGGAEWGRRHFWWFSFNILLSSIILCPPSRCESWISHSVPLTHNNLLLPLFKALVFWWHRVAQTQGETFLGDILSFTVSHLSHFGTSLMVIVTWVTSHIDLENPYTTFNVFKPHNPVCG